MLAPVVISLALTVSVLGSLLARDRGAPLRLTIMITAFVVVSIFLFPFVGSTLHPAFAADDHSTSAMVQRLFVAAWWLMAARILVLGGQITIGIQHREHAARLASDLASGVVYLGAVLITLSVAFSVSVAGLVATSGIIAIVLGLALQSTLGDLFSGIALNIEKPFGIGDYIWLEGGIEGSVIETNWRATRIVTDNNDTATVPNSVIAKGRLLNRSRPTEIRTDTVRIILDSTVLPKRGAELLTAAVLSTEDLASTPPPRVVCTDVRGEGTTYEIRFSAPGSKLMVTRSELFHNVARHTRYAGVALAMQNGLPLAPAAAPDRMRLVFDDDLLRDLTADERTELASQLLEHRGQAGEFLFTQGGHKASLFFIAEGVFEVLHRTEAGTRRLGVISAGEHIGELSLLTGSPMPGSIRAVTPFLVYELTKEILSPSMCNNPNLLHAFEAGAARSQERIDRLLNAHDTSEKATGHLVDRIRSFFNLQF